MAKHPTAYSINGREVDKARFDEWHRQKAIVDRNKARSKALSRMIPEVSKREESKVLKSVAKKGYYASPAAKKAIKASDKRQESYAKERAERYKREGLT